MTVTRSSDDALLVDLMGSFAGTQYEDWLCRVDYQRPK
jgi:hypothetical protein